MHIPHKIEAKSSRFGINLKTHDRIREPKKHNLFNSGEEKESIEEFFTGAESLLAEMVMIEMISVLSQS